MTASCVNIANLVSGCILALGAALQAEPIPAALEAVLSNRCFDCHDDVTRKGDLDLLALADDFDWTRDYKIWVEVESMIAEKTMPPEGKTPLSEADLRAVDDWFEREFVTPDGVQRPGTNRPRRLTREELQNTLEDILHLDLRPVVTNSALGMIPESTIEKFFAEGVTGKSGFSNDAETLNQSSMDIDTLNRAFSMVLSELDHDEAARIQLFGRADVTDITKSEAQEILGNFVRFAFRRPLEPGELEPFMEVYDRRSSSGSYPALKSSIKSVLLSPMFFYRFEQRPEGRSLVKGYELANRLSYFLWSTSPDQELYDLAANGELHQPDVLREQVKRMLADPKRIALAENLGGEWFDFKPLRLKSPAANDGKTAAQNVYRSQYEEALLFFDSIIRYNEPLTSLVDADWSFLNRRTTGAYRTTYSKKTKSFEKDPLPAINLYYRDHKRQIEVGEYEQVHDPVTLRVFGDRNHGGFVSLGSTMTATSTVNQTSPIRRGTWVIERILGKHFKTPKDVPAIDEAKKTLAAPGDKLTEADLLTIHSKSKSCASCHKYIDPIGLGLEFFNKFGVARKNAPEVLEEVESYTYSTADYEGDAPSFTWELEEPLDPNSKYFVTHRYIGENGGRMTGSSLTLAAGETKLGLSLITVNGERLQEIRFPNNQQKVKLPSTGWKFTATFRKPMKRDATGHLAINKAKQYDEVYRLPNGQTFSSPAELKQQLLAHYHDEIVENVVEKVLGYALGRKTEPVDRPAIREIIRTIEAQDYRMNSVIEEVVMSYPFLHKES